MRNIIALLSCVFFVGCGGHGYEGNYRISYKSDNPFVSATLSVADHLGGMEKKRAAITNSSLEINGRFQAWNEVEVQNEGSERFLVFKNPNSEKRFKVIDQDTLQTREGPFTLTLDRIKD